MKQLKLIQKLHLFRQVFYNTRLKKCKSFEFSSHSIAAAVEHGEHQCKEWGYIPLFLDFVRNTNEAGRKLPVTVI